MAKFILVYRANRGIDATADADALEAWQTFLRDVIEPHVVDPGWPVFEPSTALGETGASTQLGGYSVVEVNDMQAALAIARQCPALERAGGVEVGLLSKLVADHPAEDMRARASTG